VANFLQQNYFVLRFRYFTKLTGFFRKSWLSLLGMSIGKGTNIPKIYTTWPHQIDIGNNCIIERGSYFKYDGIWKKGKSIVIKDNVFIGKNCEFNIKRKITVGDSSMIASGCKFIDHNHTKKMGSVKHMNIPDAEAEIIIGTEVWLGFNVIILMGVVIGDYAIIAAGAVVTKSIPANEIWAGVPAKKIGQRK
jgi:acetyltransferase-like isoleucine patch superfamily enzyme